MANLYHWGTDLILSPNTSTAREDPRVPGRYLVPANSTLDVPLTPVTGKVCIRRNNAWHLVDDVRGTWYNKTTKAQVTVTSITADVSALTRTAPRQFDHWDVQANTWAFDFEGGKAIRLEQVKQNAYDIIISRYPIWKQVDISNLIGYTQEQKTEMFAFITNIREQCNSFETMLSHLAIDQFGDFTFNYTVPA